MYPALFGGRHRQPIGWYTFPTRMETLLVASYWLINIIFLVVRRGGAELQVDPSKLIADRAGVLALWNMPIFFLLAGRNDFLVWLTGWPYGTFHVFHKWIARVSALMGMIHSVAYAVYMYQSMFFMAFPGDAGVSFFLMRLFCSWRRGQKVESGLLVEWCFGESFSCKSRPEYSLTEYPKAMIVMGLILCLSVFPFRKKAYEFFLFCHILGVIMFLSFLY